MKWHVAGFVVAFLMVASCTDQGTNPTPPRLSRVEIRLTPAVATIPVGDTVRAYLVGFDQYAKPYPTGVVTWRSQNPSVATITSDGLVQSRGFGAAQIVAVAGSQSASLTLQVAGTLHDAGVTTSEVWTLAAGPHVVKGRIPVGGPGGVVLTIEAGASVLFRSNGGLDFGVGGDGTLVTTPGSGAVTMQGVGPAPTPGFWTGLTFQGAGQSELRSVTLKHCGGPQPGSAGCIVVRDPGLGPVPLLLVDNVAITDGVAGGIILEGKSTFAPGSARLSIERVRGVVASLSAAVAADFPVGGSFGGNDVNEIHLRGDTIKVAGTWANHGLPWHVFGRVFIEGSDAPTLTIREGSRLIFDFGAGFVVGQGAAGGLRIGAAGGDPVVLVGEGQDTWVGLQFWPAALPSSITNTGLQNCGTLSQTGFGEGCLVFVGDGVDGPAPVLEGVTISGAEGAGVLAIGRGRFGQGSQNLLITGTRGVPVSIQATDVPSLPTGNYRGNQYDAIGIITADVTETQTWRNLGVPYSLPYELVIEHPRNPVLTLEPGVVLRFRAGARVRVGTRAPGGLRAVGTDAAPVVLTAESSPAQPGFWIGIEIGPAADPTTLFDHAMVVEAGASDGQVASAIRIARDYGEIVRNTVIRLSGGCGIARLGGEPWTTDFTAPHLANLYEQNAGPAQCGP